MLLLENNPWQVGVMKYHPEVAYYPIIASLSVLLLVYHSDLLQLQQFVID